MENTILMDLAFTEVLEKLDPKFLADPKPTKYECFRAINIFSLDKYYKLFSLKANDLLINQKLLESFPLVIDQAVKLLRLEYYPKDRILLIYAFIMYYTLINSGVDLGKLENSLILDKELNKRKLAKRYLKGYFKEDLVIEEFLDLLIRETISYPGGIEYYKNAFKNKYYMIAFFKGSTSKFKAFILKIINKIYKKDFKEEKNNLDGFKEAYEKIINDSKALINAFNNYLYFKKEKQFHELLEIIKKPQD